MLPDVFGQAVSERHRGLPWSAEVGYNTQGHVPVRRERVRAWGHLDLDPVVPDGRRVIGCQGASDGSAYACRDGPRDLDRVRTTAAQDDVGLVVTGQVNAEGEGQGHAVA